MNAYGLTDIGKVRQSNQDSFYLSHIPAENQVIAIICDGMGGAKAGNVASELAINYVRDGIRDSLKPKMSADYIKNMLITSVTAANKIIYEKSLESKEYEGMGTTIVALIIDGDKSVIVNVGDSRAYIVSKGEIKQLTHDHSLVEDMIDKGELTREQARNHPGKNLLTRSLGTENSVLCDVFIEKTADIENILLCSDGLSNSISDKKILNLVTKELDCVKCCEQLVKAANSGGGSDNITVVLIRP